MISSALNTYFTKAFLMAPHLGKSDAELAALIGGNPYFIKDYRNLIKHYPMRKIERVLQTLGQIDLRSKGILTNTGDENLYKELLVGLV